MSFLLTYVVLVLVVTLTGTCISNAACFKRCTYCYIVNRGIFHVLHSILLNLSPLGFHCMCRRMLGSNVGLLWLWHWQSDALTAYIVTIDVVVWNLKFEQLSGSAVSILLRSCGIAKGRSERFWWWIFICHSLRLVFSSQKAQIWHPEYCIHPSIQICKNSACQLCAQKTKDICT